MECNRDEAIRAKTIAEKKLADKDFAGAKKFTLKAQTLYPGLDGISQMLITLDVYISADNKVNGEADWYRVLGVNPSDDDETIRKQYRKLALMLHPDKNKSTGADGAFKILSEAWSLLSDKAKRSAYNQRRDSRGFQQRFSCQSRVPSAAPGVNGVCSFANRATSKPKNWSSTTATRGGPASVPHQAPPPFPARAPTPPPVFQHRTDTFWTTCIRCKMHYEYLRVYLNHTLICPNCQRPFLAKEMAAPVNFPKPAHSSVHPWHQNSSNHPPSSKQNGNLYNPWRSTASAQNCGQLPSGPSSSNNANGYQGPLSRTNVPGKTGPSVVSKAANVVQQVNDRLKREREESSYAGWPLKKHKEDDNGQSSSVKIPYQTSG